MRTIVEKSHFRIFRRQFKHVGISPIYSLICMTGHGNHHMLRKDRIRIYKNMIFVAAFRIEFNPLLLCRTVLFTKETSPLSYILLIEFRCRRNHPGWIVLQSYGKSSDFHLPDKHIFKGLEIVGSKRPCRQLVRKEFLY